MYTETQIYDFITGDTLIGYNINGQNVYLNNSRNITTDKILSGYTSYAQDGSPISGTMPNNGEINITPSKSQQTIPAGYTSGGTVEAVTNSIDSNIQASNIKKDVSILGVTGTLEEGIDTSDGTATADNIEINKTAYVNGQKVTGNVPLFLNTITYTANGDVYNDTENSRIKLSTTNATKQILDSGVNMEIFSNYSNVATAIGLTADKIKSGETVLGIAGTTEPVEDYIQVPASETTLTIQKCMTLIPLLDTSNATNMNKMFDGCSSLITIPLLNTSNVTNMSYMFRNCTNLTNIPLLNTSNVTDATSMFESCTNLTNLPLLDTSKIVYMNYMFGACSNLTSIPQIDTSSSKYMQYTFESCSNLTTMPQLNLSNVESLNKTFYGLDSLSNDSLNNILASLQTATSYTGIKTLAYIGLSETQATTCTTLTNWENCEAAGWTTGY